MIVVEGAAYRLPRVDPASYWREQVRKRTMTKIKKTLSQAIQERRATPSFDGTPIPAEDLRQILDAGLHAPSGYNMQPWRFVVVQSPGQKKRLRAASCDPCNVEAESAGV